MSDADQPPSEIHPSLTYDDAPAAIAWLCRTFGFRRRFVVPRPDGGVQHSELTFGRSVIMVSSPKPEERRFGPQACAGASVAFSVFVGDVDAHHARSVAEGVCITRALRSEPYGARGYGAKDLEGHSWYFSDYLPGAYWDS